MRERYKIRHQILEHLFSKIQYTDASQPLFIYSKTPLKDIATAIDVSYEKVVKYHHQIPDDQVECVKNSPLHEMQIKRAGYDAVINEYWLKEGRKDLHDSIYDVTRWIVPVVALFVSAISIIYTANSAKENKGKIEALQTRLIQDSIELSHQRDMVNKLSESLTTGRMSERLRYVDSLILSTRKK